MTTTNTADPKTAANTTRAIRQRPAVASAQQIASQPGRRKSGRQPAAPRVVITTSVEAALAAKIDEVVVAVRARDPMVPRSAVIRRAIRIGIDEL